jgi:hypothetical protein
VHRSDSASVLPLVMLQLQGLTVSPGRQAFLRRRCGTRFDASIPTGPAAEQNKAIRALRSLRQWLGACIPPLCLVADSAGPSGDSRPGSEIVAWAGHGRQNPARWHPSYNSPRILNSYPAPTRWYGRTHSLLCTTGSWSR